MTTHTSRRAIMAGAAAVPLAAATSSALAEADDAELLRLAAEVMAAYGGLGDAIDVQSVAETKVFQWIDANPKPDPESAGWRDWSRREAAFCREIGFDAAWTAAQVAGDKLYAALDALVRRPARTIHGLITKARLVGIDEDALGYRMVPSIIDDLLEMGDQS
jgi:hypothetical protein